MKNTGKSKKKLTYRLEKPRGQKHTAVMPTDSPITDVQLHSPDCSKKPKVKNSGRKAAKHLQY
jgi:hypothetical protein